LAGVREQIHEYPAHLRDRLPEIRDAIKGGGSGDGQTAPRRVGGFHMPEGIKDFEAGVRWYVDAWFESLVQTLEDGVVDQLDENQLEGMQAKARQAVADLRTHLDGLNPDFWRRYGEGGKLEVAEQLASVVNRSFDPLEQQVNAELKRHGQNSWRCDRT
jgi:hypothetical protein